MTEQENATSVYQVHANSCILKIEFGLFKSMFINYVYFGSVLILSKHIISMLVVIICKTLTYNSDCLAPALSSHC